MKALKPSKKWVLAVIGLVLVLFVLKIVSLLTAKPKITVDYVAEYNRITRPENYDPNENAAPYYRKAFDAFVEIPSHNLRDPRKELPADFNETEQKLLKEWLASNSQAFEYFKIAAAKPYYWLERYTEGDNSIINITFPERTPLHHLTEALMWNAKLSAFKGQPQAAFENIIDCYRAARQKYRTPSCLMEQHIGMDRKKITVENALIILDKTQVNSSDLKFFRDALQAEFGSDTYVPDFTVEKFFLYDALQKTFIDNGRGTGRLAWRMAYAYDTLCGVWANRMRRLNCFIGPTRNQIVQQTEKVFTLSNQIMTKTPWQIKSEGYDYFEEIDKIKNSNFFSQLLIISPKSTFDLYYQTRAQMEALIAITAILRFKEDNHRFPETFDELVSAGYLQSVPMDPYSDGPLIYKPTGDNFKLYSVGEDFTDDGGVAEARTRQESGFSGGAYTVPYVYSPDIVYWPVKRFGHFLKEFEKLRAEKKP
jgi:hypothetical protein